MDIIEFLTAQYDAGARRAELAQQAIAGDWDCWAVVAQQLHACCDTVPMIGRVGQLLQIDADPARVLADIAAKRKLLVPHTGDHVCAGWSGESYFDDGDPCLTLCLLAAPYADRPGYAPAWAVDA